MSAKEIRVGPMSREASDAVVKKWHYSGKVVRNAQLHFGVWKDGVLHGAMVFGPPMDKSKSVGLVRGTKWSGMLELNRMAFDPFLPRNSESRALSIALRFIRKNYPHVEWIQSFADAGQCGDGAIYRAAGFVLTGITRMKEMFLLPNGEIIHALSLHTVPNVPRPELGGRTYFEVTKGRYSNRIYKEASGAVEIPGHSLRYIYFLNKEKAKELTVPIIPFSEIERRGIGMYRGKKISRATSDTVTHPDIHSEEGGSIPTVAL